MDDFGERIVEGFSEIRNRTDRNKNIRINIDALIDCLDDKAVKFCIDNLYCLFNFRVLKKSDLRKVDLKEYLYPYVKYVNEHSDYTGSGNFYIQMIKIYLIEFIKVRSNSRARKYHIHAQKLINQNKGTNNALTIVEDVFIIFISLFRSHGNDLKMCRQKGVNEVCLDVDEKDVGIIHTLCNDRFFIPQGLYKYKEHMFSKETITPQYEISMKRKFFYSVSIILLAYFLQERGHFDYNMNYD